MNQHKSVMMDPAKLKPHPRNSRKHTSAQISALREAILEFGFTQPAVVDGNNTILIGHARTEAALDAELDEIPVLIADSLTDEQQRALLIADNRLGEVGSGWNEAKLNEQLRQIMGQGFDLTITGFELPKGVFAPEQDEDVLPPEDKGPPISQIGDVWHLGPHRLYVGQAEDPAIQAAIMAHNPKVMVTDPPYGVEYDPEWRNDELGSNTKATGTVLNDDKADWTEVWQGFTGNVAYVWHAGTRTAEVAQSLVSAKFKPEATIIWVKDRAAISRGAYHHRHEPCFYACRKGATVSFTGGTQSSHWSIPMVKNTTGHGTQKPVEAMRRPILPHTKKGDVVYDPFLGSGTTVIACETTGRVCMGSELSPDYADVIVNRWAMFTGKTPELIREGKPVGNQIGEGTVIEEIQP